MPVLIVKNIAVEGPGTIEDFLKEHGKDYEILELYDCRAEIPDLRPYSHLVVMGGPMSVYEMDEHAFLSYEVAMIRSCIKNGKAVLGICLGAQMIAHALGADVYPGEIKEIGWGRVEITGEGMDDSVISTIAVDNEQYAEVFQWHGDTFDLPDKAVRISTSDDYKNQAFRYKSNVYALQFHIEVTPGMIKEWFKDDQSADIDKMMDHTHKIYPEYRMRAINFYKTFFS